MNLCDCWEKSDGDASANTRSGRILVLDDEVMIRTLPNEILDKEGYELTIADDGEEAIQFLLNDRFDLIVTDIVMPRKNGNEVLCVAK